MTGLALPSSSSRTSSARRVRRRPSSRRQRAGELPGRPATTCPKRNSSSSTSARSPARVGAGQQRLDAEPLGRRRAAPTAPTSGRRPARRAGRAPRRRSCRRSMSPSRPARSVAGAGRVGQRPPQPRLAPQQAATERISSAVAATAAGSAPRGVRVEALGRGRVRLPAGGLHQRAPRALEIGSGTARRCPCAAPRRPATHRRSCWPGRPRACRPRCAARARWSARSAASCSLPGRDDPVGLLPRLGEDVLPDALGVGPGLVADRRPRCAPRRAAPGTARAAGSPRPGPPRRA